MDLNKTVIIALVLSLASATTWADTFAVGTANEFDIDFVNIGNSGNVADGNGRGQVNEDFRIGQFEVTIDQFAKAHAASGNTIGNGNEGFWNGVSVDAPATQVSWQEAAKFSNWLSSGDISVGVYTISGGIVTGINRNYRNSNNMAYMIPTEDEWYKAAYFDASGVNGYSAYANGTGVAPVAGDINYFGVIGASTWPAGTAPVAEQNGTEDMMGNVWEWTESAFNGANNVTNTRAVRGGWYFSDETQVGATNGRKEEILGLEASNYGFRVAAVPEPGTISLMSLSTVSLFLVRTMRRKKRLGSSLLPVRRENACDRFENTEAYHVEEAEYEEWGYVSDLQIAVGEKISAVWSGVVSVYSNLDKVFWNRMVESYERRKAKRIAFRAMLKKRLLDAFDTFLSKIMK